MTFSDHAITTILKNNTQILSSHKIDMASICFWLFFGYQMMELILYFVHQLVNTFVRYLMMGHQCLDSRLQRFLFCEAKTQNNELKRDKMLNKTEENSERLIHF